MDAACDSLARTIPLWMYRWNEKILRMITRDYLVSLPFLAILQQSLSHVSLRQASQESEAA